MYLSLALIMRFSLSLLVLLLAFPSFAGQQATALASIAGGFVSGIAVMDGGSGYSYPPDVWLMGGGGSGASAVALIEGGAVKQVVVVTAGSGYTNPPTVTIAPPADARLEKLWEVDFASAGIDYLDGPDSFSKDGSAILTFGRGNTNGLAWVTTNGIAFVDGYSSEGLRFVSAGKAILLATALGDRRLSLLTLSRVSATQATVEKLDLSSLALPGAGQNEVSLCCNPPPPPTARDCFSLVFRASPGGPVVKRVAYRIVDPAFRPTLTFEHLPAEGKTPAALGVHNTDGGTIEVQSSSSLNSWKSISIIPNAPPDFNVKLPPSSATNLFFRAFER